MAGPKDDELEQIANLVIDAFLRRDEVYEPEFEDGTDAIMFLSEPEDAEKTGDAKRRKPLVNVWYYRDESN